jgi:hypothetical protein
MKAAFLISLLACCPLPAQTDAELKALAARFPPMPRETADLRD